ncbi:MAG: DUF2721 domain-containing protein [Cyanobium sp. M30B3]|nr:MAG: DUF2721 domain-containing protein [Cyanobium sp. M30B3]
MSLGCEPGVESLARAIQLSVSPVFLLAGISGLLGVLTTRLSRVVDRLLQHRRDHDAQERLLGHAPEIPPALRIELQLQRRRLRLSIAAITLATLSFLTVASLVMLLFVGVVTRFDLSPLVAVLFMLAMGLLMAAVLTLVLEIRLGSRIASNF